MWKGKKSTSQCSMKFMCMSTCDIEKPPTSIKDRTALSNAGLGDAVISFNSDEDSSHFHGKLLQKFQQLASSGYELPLFCCIIMVGKNLRSAPSNRLMYQGGSRRWLGSARYTAGQYKKILLPPSQILKLVNLHIFRYVEDV